MHVLKMPTANCQVCNKYKEIITSSHQIRLPPPMDIRDPRDVTLGDGGRGWGMRHRCPQSLGETQR